MYIPLNPPSKVHTFSSTQTQGFPPEPRNWRWGHLEIDIITIDGEGLHFVEVKSRKAPLTADPLDNITTTKMHRIAAAANGYLHSAGKKVVFGTDLEVFFDVVTVVFEGKGWTVEYFPKSYTPVYL